MSQAIKAAILGDSHATLLRKHAAPDVLFEFSVTAPAKHFFGKFHDVNGGDLRITPDDLATQFPNLDANRLQAMLNARMRLNDQLQPVLAAKAPVISTLGGATYRFCRAHAAAHRSDPNQPTTISKKMIRAILQDFCQHYIRFYNALLNRCESVTFILGPSRYPPQQKDLWLHYDAFMIEQLSRIGVDVVDIRPETCDADLRLHQCYEAEDILHANGAWYDVLCAHLSDRFPEFARIADRNAASRDQ